MADTYATVVNPRYAFRGNTLGKGTIVRLTKAQLEAANTRKPISLQETKAPAEGAAVIDMRPKAQPKPVDTGLPPERPALKAAAKKTAPRKRAAKTSAPQAASEPKK